MKAEKGLRVNLHFYIVKFHYPSYSLSLYLNQFICHPQPTNWTDTTVSK